MIYGASGMGRSTSLTTSVPFLESRVEEENLLSKAVLKFLYVYFIFYGEIT